MVASENLVTLHGHTINLGLLPQHPRVLDVGCRDFKFSRAIIEARPTARITALDPDPTIEKPQDLTIAYFRYALTGDGDLHYRNYASFSTGEGNFIVDGDVDLHLGANVFPVRCVSTATLVLNQFIHWDLVKLDCEGSEFEILENWPGPLATQISVEFHDYKNPEKYNAEYFEWLWKRLPDYRVVQHEAFPVGPGGVIGHWDSLLVLR